MSYLLLDDGFAEHPKVRGLSHVAFRFHVEALNHCARNLTDGHVDDRAIRSIAAGIGSRSTKPITELTTAGLWVEETCGYSIHHYLEHNPSAAQIKARKEAGRKAARSRWGNTAPNADRIADRTSNRNAEPNGMPHPIPSHGVSSFLTSPALDAARTNGHESIIEEPAFALLHLAVGPTDGNLTKLRRAARGLPLAAIVHAREAAQGPGVRDPLAVALAELKKSRDPAGLATDQ